MLNTGMDNSSTMDWEKTICQLMDRAVQTDDRAEQLRLMEEVVSEVEDLVFTAYFLGKQKKE